MRKKYKIIKKFANIWNFFTFADSEHVHSKTLNKLVIVVYFL